jgi:transcription initiation factor TFIIB
MGLATMIGRPNRDATGRPLSEPMRTTVSRLRTWDSRSQVHASMDRNLRQAFSELERYSEKLSLSEALVEKAAYIYRKALERGFLRGRSITETIAASLYAACRVTETPRTLKDIAVVSNLAKKEVARSYRLLLREMDLRMPIADPAKAVSRIASRVQLSEKTKRRALEILRKAGQVEALTGKDPMGLAAAALYIACTLEGEGKTQRDLARAGEITEVTIRNRYRGLRAALQI